MKIAIILATLLICTPVYAKKACMAEAKKLEDISVIFTELGCEKGDYFSAYTYTYKKRRELRMRAALMQVCDLSQPFSIESAKSGSYSSVFLTCTLSGEQLDVVYDEDAKKDIH